MDVDALAFELFAISDAREKLQELVEHLDELRRQQKVLHQATQFLAQCEQVGLDLESERKSHSEELRLINQDINHLEDIMKGVRSGYDSQKPAVIDKYHECRTLIDSSNEVVRSSGMDEELVICQELLSRPDWYDASLMV
ncbi:zinc finger protein [Aphelenchoides avenae]|nr:zinc finger protein [Aphelenchus avenae]